MRTVTVAQALDRDQVSMIFNVSINTYNDGIVKIGRLVHPDPPVPGITRLVV